MAADTNDDTTTLTNEKLLVINHEIREIEHAIAIARRRKWWSNVSLILGPFLAVVLYGMLWIPALKRTLVYAVYIPTIPVAIGFCVSSLFLKTHRGYPEKSGGTRTTYIRESDLELELARKRDARKLLVASAATPPRIRRVTYKEDAYADIDRLRLESKRYRNVNNFLQGILIIGSLAATGASGIAADMPGVRWAILGLTFAVGISSGFMGYFKYKERSFYLQQTADAIENEWEAVEIGVGRYKKLPEDEALAEFAEEVHRLKSEQKKRQQNLEQPPEARNENE